MWYTILPGDSLSLLAQKYLGSLMLFNEIYEENKDVLRDPNIVVAGTKIWIPIDGKSKPIFSTTQVTTTTTPKATQTISPYQSTFSPVSAQVKLATSNEAKLKQETIMMYGGIALAAAALVMAFI